MKSTAIVLFLHSFLAAKSENFKPRLVGGQPVDNNQPLYQGSLTVYGIHVCGVTLITNSHLLTAGHCVKNIVAERPIRKVVKVALGSTNFNECVSYSVLRISHHRDFRKGNHSPYYYNDIAVVHLLNPVKRSASVVPIPLPAESLTVPPNSRVIVSGFGGKERGQRHSTMLLQIFPMIEPLNNCQEWYSFYFLDNNHICTTTKYNIGVGIGDAGNPMVDLSRSVLLGISSGNNGASAIGIPNIYTKVSSYISYIKEEISYFDSDNVTLPNPPPAVNFPFYTQRFL